VSRWAYGLASNNNGNVIILGSYFDNSINGAAIIYTGDSSTGWAYKQNLMGNNLQDSWGHSVDTNNDGSVIVLGGWGGSSQNGAAIVYTGNAASQWTFKQTLTGDAGQNYWGHNVATNSGGNVIVLGAWGDDSRRGSAIIYTGNATAGWKYKQKLTGDPNINYRGYSVSTNNDGSVIVLGAYRDNSNSGSAIVYTGNATSGWAYKQKLTGDAGTGYYGWSTATNGEGNVIVFGGWGNNNNSGAAIIYTGNAAAGWTYKQKLTGDGGQDRWGHSVSTNNDGSVIVLGGWHDSNISGVAKSGAALLYTGNATAGWTYKQKLSGNSGENYWGHSVATNGIGNVIALGSFYNNTSSGSILVFSESTL
jgi:hypothetical protein